MHHELLTSPELLVGAFTLGGILVLIAMRMPIGVALMLGTFIALTLTNGSDVALSMFRTVPFEILSKWSLTAIPMFLLMGALTFHLGLSQALFRAARLWLNWLPGGLAVATNFACAGFAAVSGSSAATAASIGRIAIPEMRAQKYDDSLATGVVAAAGTLGALIPPSILFILFGVFAEVSILKLFLAGIIPGLLTAAVYAVMIVTRCTLNPELAPRTSQENSSEKWSALLEIWPVIVLMIGIFAGIYGGLVTPTEAGAYGSALTILIGIATRRMTFANLMSSLRSAAETTSSFFLVAVGATMFAKFLALCGTAWVLGEIATSLSTSPLQIFLVTAALLLLLGMFLDPLGVMLISLPILLPFYETTGIDLVWFGVIMVKFVEIGLLTPPVGFNVYVVKSVVGKTASLGVIFRGVGWFLVCEAIIMALLFKFPALSLAIPNFVY